MTTENLGYKKPEKMGNNQNKTKELSQTKQTSSKSRAKESQSVFLQKILCTKKKKSKSDISLQYDTTIATARSTELMVKQHGGQLAALRRHRLLTFPCVAKPPNSHPLTLAQSPFPKVRERQGGRGRGLGPRERLRSWAHVT